MHFARAETAAASLAATAAAEIALGFALGTACRAADRRVGETALRVEFLLARSEHEVAAAVAA